MRSRPNSSASWLPLLAAACGIATFSVMDALMKGASQVAGVYAAMLGRNLVGVVLAFAAWQIGFGGRWPKAARLRLHAARAAIAGVMGFSFFWGLVRVPMAVGMGLSFVAPIVALYLSALFLGEAVTRRALFASLLGLAGVVVIALEQAQGQGGDEGLIGMMAILLSSVLYAINLVMQRHQAQLASPGEIAFFQNLFITLALLPVGMFLPPVPPVSVWWQVALAALLSVSSLMLMAWGWARAPAHQLLPMEYSAFVWAALAGWLWFGERLGVMTLVGVGLIVGGCWYGSASRPPNPAEALSGDTGD